MQPNAALEFLTNRKETNIVVVTHGEILRLMLALMVFGSDVALEIYERMNQGFATSNAGMTKVKYDRRGWYILTWNEHAHLQLQSGELFDDPRKIPDRNRKQLRH